MAGWRTSSWYGSSWYNSTWYGGTGGGGASTVVSGSHSRTLRLVELDEILPKRKRRKPEQVEQVEKLREEVVIAWPPRYADGVRQEMLRSWPKDRAVDATRKATYAIDVRKTERPRVAVNKYDPDQPRDEDGKFGEGGSGAGRTGTVGGSKPAGGDHKTAAKAFAKQHAQTFKTGDAKAVKEAQSKFLAAQGFTPEEIATHAAQEKQWYSSVYTEGGQVMRQVAAKEMGRDFKETDYHDSKPILDRGPTDRERGMVNAVRSFTTEGLREKYGDSVTIYRGVADAQADALMGGDGSTVDMGLNSLSSWSLEKDTAENYALFGKTKSGALVSVKVPVENVWLADFKEGRNEVVIGAKQARIRVPRSAVSPRMRKAVIIGEFSYPTDGKGKLVVLDDDPESANWLNAVDVSSSKR